MDEIEDRIDKGVPQPTKISMPVSRNTSLRKREPEAIATEADFAAILGRLALHYWRPDFAPGQVKLWMDDFVRLMSPIAPKVLQSLCDAWLSDGANKFFPTPGQLLEIRKARFGSGESARSALTDRPLPDSRPLMWWTLPRDMWKPNWKETDPH